MLVKRCVRSSNGFSGGGLAVWYPAIEFLVSNNLLPLLKNIFAYKTTEHMLMTLVQSRTLAPKFIWHNSDHQTDEFIAWKLKVMKQDIPLLSLLLLF